MIGASPTRWTQPGVRGDAQDARACRTPRRNSGLDWQLPPLAVSFAPAPGAAPGLGLPIEDAGYGNLHGRQRTTCRLCGECDIGCNDGAKNTLDYTYLSAARHHGADLRTWHEVRAIRPRPAGGYEVDYIRHDAGRRQRPRAPRPAVRDDRLRPAGAGRGHLRHVLPAAAQPRALSRPELGPRHPVLRQRRPAELPHQRQGPQRGPAARRQPRSRHHQRHPAERRA